MSAGRLPIVGAPSASLVAPFRSEPLARYNLYWIDGPPWRVEMTGAAKPGENTLEIAVVNLWPNRLVGDKKLPAAQRRTRTRMFMGGLNNDQLPSGLLGPVTLQTVQAKEIKGKS